LKNFRTKARLTLFLFLSISFFTSCNKNEELGENIQPSDDRMGVSFIQSIPVTAYTVYEDSIKSDETTYNLLGSYCDPVFGQTNAGIYTQFKLTTTAVDFGDSPICDSVVLSMAYAGVYGDSAATMRINVNEIADDFYYDNYYYSNDKLGTYKTNLANIDFVPNFTDSIQVGTTKYPAHFRIKLKKTLGQKFINASGTSDLNDNTNFLKFFKGLYISANTVSSGGAILYLNLLSSLTKLSLYYHNVGDTASTTYNFIISDDCARFTAFDHKKFANATPVLKQQLAGDTVLGDSILFVQAMAGTKIKLKFPDVIGLNALGKIAINKAELVMKVDENSIGDYTPPEKLILSKINANGTVSFLADYAYGDAYYGGYYSSTTKEYRFNISKHIQDALLNGSFEDQGLYLVVSGAAVKSNRAVIKGNKSSQDNLRLEIIYTKID